MGCLALLQVANHTLEDLESFVTLWLQVLQVLVVSILQQLLLLELEVHDALVEHSALAMGILVGPDSARLTTSCGALIAFGHGLASQLVCDEDFLH